MSARKLAKPKPKRGGRRHGLSDVGPSVRLSVCLPPALADWVALKAFALGLTQAEVARRAVALQMKMDNT